MRNLFVTLLICFVPAITMAKNKPTLAYHVSIPLPQTHYAEVSISISDVTTADLHFKMPVWTPGSYFIREFEKSVEGASATVDGHSVKIERPDKNTWKISGTKNKNVQFSYRVYAFEASVRTSFIDADGAFLHNTSLLMYPEELLRTAGTLNLKLPESWKNVSTTLESDNAGNYIFSDYDELADSPIEAGNHEILEFTVMDVPHRVAMVGLNNCDSKKFTEDLKKMCETMAGIIGEHPCKQYLFIVKNVETGGGGLEHANSCTVMMGRWNWTDEKKYKGFLGLCAHEYFHLWNVKRLRPVELGPFNYSAENYTDLLWVAEGITSYYDELAMLRAGLTDREGFTEVLEGYINRLENRPGSKVLSLAQSSRDAWVKEYRPNENTANTAISYYSKGLVVAALLDAHICRLSKGEKNLDDLLRLLYKRYYKELNRGFTPEEFTKAASEIAGADLSSFFEKHVYTTETPDYGKILSSAGLNVDAEISDAYKLGITTAIDNGKTIIKEVTAQSTAWFGGLNVGDELISLNGTRVNNDADKILDIIGQPGIITAVISRSGIVREITMNAIPLKTVNYILSVNDSPGQYTPALEKWLGK